MNSESASEFTKDIREIEKFEVYKLELSGLYLHYVYGESVKFKLFFDLSRTSSYLYSTYRDSTVFIYYIFTISYIPYTNIFFYDIITDYKLLWLQKRCAGRKKKY